MNTAVMEMIGTQAGGRIMFVVGRSTAWVSLLSGIDLTRQLLHALLAGLAGRAGARPILVIDGQTGRRLAAEGDAITVDTTIDEHRIVVDVAAGPALRVRPARR